MNPQTIVIIITTVLAYYLAINTLKTTESDGELTKNEKVWVIGLMIVNPLISWVVFSTLWKTKLPIKAKQVNEYLRKIIKILVGVGVAGIVVALMLIAIRPTL